MADQITLTIDGRSTSVATGTTVAAAIAIAADAREAAGAAGAAGRAQIAAAAAGASPCAAALASAGQGVGGAGVTRRSVGGQARAPLCGMGVCQECRVTVNGRAHVLSCQTLAAPGMDVLTGAAA